MHRAFRVGTVNVRILMTANAAWNVWHFRRAVVREMLSLGHTVTVLAPFDSSVSEIEAMGCRFVHLDMDAKGVNPLSEFKLMRRMKRTFTAEAPHMILSYTIKNNIFGAFAAKSCGVPFVPNVTGLGTAFLSNPLIRYTAETLYRRAFDRLETVFFQNEDDRELFVARRMVKPSQAVLLPGSGIDLEHFSPVTYPQDDAAPVFLMVARLLRDKGVVEFVDAARLVKAAHPAARFQILGAIGSENRTAIPEHQVRAWVEEGVVEYLGTAPDVRPIISQASCIVLPSYREGAPRTLIEAAAMARPVITTDVPGCRAIIDRDVSGLLCEVRSAASLAQAIERFLGLSRVERIAMGNAGRLKMSREYSEDLVVARYKEALLRADRQVSGVEAPHG